MDATRYGPITRALLESDNPPPPDMLALLPWRVGRELGRAVFAQVNPEPSDDDILIGTLDTEPLASDAVSSHNLALTLTSHVQEPAHA